MVREDPERRVLATFAFVSCFPRKQELPKSLPADRKGAVKVIPCQVNLALRHDGWLSHDTSAPGMEPPSKRPRRLSDRAREMAEIADQKNTDERNPVRDRKDAKRHKTSVLAKGTRPRASLAASAASTPARESNPVSSPESLATKSQISVTEIPGR